MGRAPCCDKANVKKGPWSPEEDAKLKAYIEKFGTGGNWIALPQKIGLKRCGKSCRLRWLNYLRPNLKHGGFTEEEDNIICSLYISIGSKWSIIAAQLPGRTDNDIKNYWNTRLKKKLLGRRKQSNANRVSIISGQEPIKEGNSKFNLQNLSSSALERLQLHMHLQTLQHPNFSFYYNNPSIWPKMMMETLNSLNQAQNINSNTNNPANQNPLSPRFCPPGQDYRTMETNELVINSIHDHHCFSSSSEYCADFALDTKSNVQEAENMRQNNGFPTGSGFGQAELDELLKNNVSSGLFPTGNQINSDEFDCFKEMDGSKESLAWWPSDEFHEESKEMYQDYDIGYSMVNAG